MKKIFYLKLFAMLAFVIAIAIVVVKFAFKLDNIYLFFALIFTFIGNVLNLIRAIIEKKEEK